MYSNHHAIWLASLTADKEKLLSTTRATQANIGWFEEFDSEHTHSTLSQLKRDTHAAQEQLHHVKSAIKSMETPLANARALAAPGLLGRIWKSTEQRVAKLHVSMLEGRLEKLRTSEITVTSELAKNARAEELLVADLERYRSFDTLEAQAVLAQLHAELHHLEPVMEQARMAAARREAAAGAVERQYENARRDILNLERDIVEAEEFNQALTVAGNPRERAMIHQECESRFGAGNGRPSDVLKHAKATHRKRSQDFEKLERRLGEIFRRLDTEIETLILDGNNLCYATAEDGVQKFIRLDMLKVLVPHLCATYKVALMFDSGIGRQLEMKDRDLKALFPEARVVIMRSKIAADEAILGQAEHDPKSYVISNDRFADFPETAAVLEGRVMSHIIHPHSVQVPQLPLNLVWNIDNSA